MKRILSLILVLALVAGLVPAAFLTTAAEAFDAGKYNDIVYGINSYAFDAAGSRLTSWATFKYENLLDTVENKWEVSSSQNANGNLQGGYFYLYQTLANASKFSVTFRIKVPSAGKYLLNVGADDFSDNSMGHAKVNFTISGNADFSDNLLDESFEFYNSRTGGEVGTFTAADSGDYYVRMTFEDNADVQAASKQTLKTATGTLGYYRVDISSIVLTPAYPAIADAELIFDDERNIVSVKSATTVNNEVIDPSLLKVKYSLEGTDKIKIDSATGMISACAEEVSAIVKAEITFGNKVDATSVTKSIPVTVKPLSLEMLLENSVQKYKETVYNLNSRAFGLSSAITDWTFLKYGNLLDAEGKWEVSSKNASGKLENQYFYLYSTISGASEFYITFKIKVPTAGTYSLKVAANSRVNNAMGKAHVKFQISDSVDFSESSYVGESKLYQSTADAEIGTFSALSAGDYYLKMTFEDSEEARKNIPNPATNGDGTLKEANNYYKADIEKITIIPQRPAIDDAEVEFDDAANVVSVKYATAVGGELIAPSLLDVEYALEGTDKVSINSETGKIEACEEETQAIAKVKVGFGGCTITKELPITVKALQLSGYFLKYNFAVAPKVDISLDGDGLTNDLTKKFWSFGATNKETLGSYARTKDLYLSTGTGQWVAVKLNVPVSGIYKTKLIYNTSPGKTPGIGKIHILPGDTSDIEKALDASTQIGEVDFYADVGEDRKEILLSNISFENAGEHYLVFSAMDYTDGFHYMFPVGLELIGGDGLAIVSAFLNRDEFDVTVGEGDTVSVETAYLSDYSEIDTYEVSYAIKDEDVATIDQSGRITGVSEGTTTVKATVAYNGTQTETIADVLVLPEGSSKHFVVYDLSVPDFENTTYDDTDKFWKYIGENAIEINVPVAGRYNIETEGTSGQISINGEFADGYYVFPSAGNYVVSFEGKVPEKLTLNGGKRTVLMNARMSFEGTIAAVDEIVYSDGTVISAENAETTYRIDDFSVASIDAMTGKILPGRAGGNTVIRADVKYNGMETEGEIAVSLPEVEINAGSLLLPFTFHTVSQEWKNEHYTSWNDVYDGGAVIWNINGITYDHTDGWAWHMASNDSLLVTSSILSTVGLTIEPGAGEWIALKLRIQAPGRYWASVENGKSFSDYFGKMDVYVVPMTDDKAELEASLTPKNKLATINGKDESLEKAKVFTEELGAVDFSEAGDYLIVFRDTGAKKKICLRSLTLDGRNGVKYATFDLDSNILGSGEKVTPYVSARLLDGTEVDAGNVTFLYSSSNENVATFTSGVIDAVGDGDTELTFTALNRQGSASVSHMVSVINTSNVIGVELVPERGYAYAGQSLRLSSVLNYEAGMPKSLDNKDVTYTIVDGNGYITDGSITSPDIGTVTVTATYGEFTSEPVKIEFKEGFLKVAPSFYTSERVANLKENVRKYDWAKSVYKGHVDSADVIVENVDFLYDNLMGKGMPKAHKVGYRDDAEYIYCRYCGANIESEYGGHIVFSYSRPWKVQCPDCKRIFPSNDFESFLELGRDEKKNFDVNIARQKHHELFVCDDGENCTCVAPNEENSDEWYEFYGYGAEGGYLYNDLFPELRDPSKPETCNIDPRTGDVVDGNRWGVDDGWGYNTGRKYANGCEEVHTYVANFAYQVPLKVLTGIESASLAYLSTGDVKYARAGSILLDRFADLFPEVYTKEFFYKGFRTSGGGDDRGKFTGRIRDAGLTARYAKAADAFFTYLQTEDPLLVNYLSEKMEEYNYEYKKTSGAEIWKNWADNLLWQSFLEVKNNNLFGNTGYPHAAASSVMLALDEEPRSSEILEWLYTTGPTMGTAEMPYDHNPGGNLAQNFIDLVDRDGMGNESSPGYNLDWTNYFTQTAGFINLYTDDPEYDLYQNPKFMMMFHAVVPITLVNSQTAQIGDSLSTAIASYCGVWDRLLEGFYYLKDTPVGSDIAKHIYMRNGNSTDGLHYNEFVKDPESMQNDVKKLVGSTPSRSSEMMAGYGFAILRDGDEYGAKNTPTYKNNLRDFWMYFGVNGGWAHAHYDALNLGVDAYGLNMAPDLGYPEDSYAVSRWQWTKTTIAHNTVVVNEKSQVNQGTRAAFPQHFDDSGEVKVMDVDASNAYNETSIYRRTLIMVNAGDDVSYGVDFFRVKGGSEHLYSFHSQSDSVFETEGLGEIEYQTDDGTSSGNYIGTYASPTVDFGPDPSNSPKETGAKLHYPIGYTWMKNVRRARDVNKFSIDYNITDFRKVISDNKNLHMRVTMLNDFELSEVAMTRGYVPDKKDNYVLPDTLEYMLARRTSETGESLDSLYTTVYELYKGERYLSDMETVSIATSEKTGVDDIAKAIKVIRKSDDGSVGRVDYIVYATNNNVTYTVTDENLSFDFRGFVGVYSVNRNGACIYSYVHDGDIIGENVSEIKQYTAMVSDFTDALAVNNYVWVKPYDEIPTEDIIGRFMFIDNDMVENGAYKIETAEVDGDMLKLGIGTKSLLREALVENGVSTGYIYNIGKGQKVTIPISNTYDLNPVFDTVTDATVSAGSSFRTIVYATVGSGDTTYIGATLPRGASVNSVTGEISWKPDSSQVGENHFAITARDAEGRESTAHFTVTVYGATTGKPSDEAESGTSTDSSGTTSGGGGGGGGGAAPSDKEDSYANDAVGDGGVITQPDVENGVVVAPQFIDLGNHAWAADSINELADAGIIKGTSENTYSPANNITRADFALLLVRAFKLDSNDVENFADVSASDYFAPELAIARNTGIINGIGDNKYAPRNIITRQDMMVIVYRALQKLDVKLESTDVDYDDFDSVADYASGAVKALITSGFINGKNGKIAPTEYTTRAEVAVLVKRIVDYLK